MPISTTLRHFLAYMLLTSVGCTASPQPYEPAVSEAPAWKTSPSASFAVSDVEIPTKPLKPYGNSKPLGLEAQMTDAPAVHPGSNPLDAVHTAFALHYPLALRPDDLWLLVLQGFTLHVRQHPEQLQKNLLTRADGKIKLLIRLDAYTMGSDKNPWPQAFAAMTGKMRDHLQPGFADTLLQPYSTTDATSEAVFHVATLDAMQEFFEYEGITLCGIPKIRLVGKPEDWDALRRRTAALHGMGCDAWLDQLDPVLAQFCDASRGKVDRAFWQSLYKYRSSSGGDFVTGHLAKFFPYVYAESHSRKNLVPNPLLDPKAFSTDDALARDAKPHNHGGLDIPKTLHSSQLPVRRCTVPFTWDYFGTKYRMLWIAGNFGVAQDPKTLEVHTVLGWQVMNLDRHEAELEALRKKEEDEERKNPFKTDNIFMDATPEDNDIFMDAAPEDDETPKNPK